MRSGCPLLLYCFPHGERFTVRFIDLTDFCTAEILRNYISRYGQPEISEVPPSFVQASQSIRIVIHTVKQLVANRIANRPDARSGCIESTTLARSDYKTSAT